MMGEHDVVLDHRMQAAVSELKQLIRSRFPSASFTLGEGQEPDGIYLRAVVDVDDPDEVTAIIIDRTIDFQVEEGLPIYVIPVRTPERRAALRQRQREAWALPISASYS